MARLSRRTLPAHDHRPLAAPAIDARLGKVGRKGLIPEGAPLLVTERAAGTWADFDKRCTEALDFAHPDPPAVALPMKAAWRRGADPGGESGGAAAVA
jgi:hypothetical protein